MGMPDQGQLGREEIRGIWQLMGFFPITPVAIDLQGNPSDDCVAALTQPLCYIIPDEAQSFINVLLPYPEEVFTYVYLEIDRLLTGDGDEASKLKDVCGFFNCRKNGHIRPFPILAIGVVSPNVIDSRRVIPTLPPATVISQILTGLWDVLFHRCGHDNRRVSMVVKFRQERSGRSSQA